MDSFRSGMQAMEKSMTAAGKKMQSIGTTMSLYVTAPIAAMGVAALKSASDAEETFSKFDTVFRDVAKSANDAFESLRDDYGLSSRAAKQLLADTGDLLTGFGFSQQAALELSTEVNQLAVDLASFTNFEGGAEGASKALTSALLGEREAVKALGIAILEEDVKKQVAINTSKGMTFATEREAKAQATLQIAMTQSKNAIGDYARTSGSFANQSKLLKARLEDISGELGKVFLPLATKITAKITEVVTWFSKLDDQVKQNIVIFAGVAAAIGPVLLGLGALMQAIPLITAGFAAIKVAVIAATGPFGLIATAIALAIPALFMLNSELKRTKLIAGEVKADLLVESLKSSREEFERLSKSLESTGLKPLEAQNRAIDLLLQQEADLLKSRLHGSRVDADASNARTQALKELKVQINQTEGAAVDLVTAFEGFSKIADSKNKEVFAQWEADLKAFNEQLAQTAKYQSALGTLTGREGEKKGIIDNGVELDGPPVVEVPQIDESSKSKFIASLAEFGASVSAVIQENIGNSFMALGDAIGTALATGTSVLSAAGSALLGGLANMLGQLGQMAIAAGIAVLGIKVALESLNPFAAIAAGVALVALSSLVKGRMKSLSGGGSSGGGDLGPAEGVPARAMGGSVQSGVPYLVGERGPEMFTPSGYGSISNARNTARAGGEMVIRVVGELIGQGTVLKAVIDDTVRIQGRTS